MEIYKIVCDECGIDWEGCPYTESICEECGGEGRVESLIYGIGN